MTLILRVAEAVAALVLAVMTIPLLLLGLLVGMRGIIRYLKMKTM